MSMFLAIKSLSGTDARESAVETLSRLVIRAVNGTSRLLTSQQNRRLVESLDDHMLRDVGLTRDDLAIQASELNRLSIWKARGHPGGLDQRRGARSGIWRHL